MFFFALYMKHLANFAVMLPSDETENSSSRIC